MDLHKLTAHEARSWEAPRMKEAVNEIRLELANIRMDIYTAKTQHAAKVRGLKRSLARVLTVARENSKKQKAN